MKNIRYELVEKPVSAWGGMCLMKELVDKTGIREFLGTLALPTPQSNRGYSPLQIIESFWVSIWTGASRFTHTAWLRYDVVLKEIFQWKEVPSQSTFSRFFGKFSWKRNDAVFVPLQQWFLEKLKLGRVTLDLDSTVMTRYGEQEGSKVGYNPQKPGRTSHHPLIAFLAETRMVVNAWLRSGNTVALSSIEQFMEETLRIMEKVTIGLVRADSGFYAERFLAILERKRLNYIVAVKFYEPIKQLMRGTTGWVTVRDGIQIKEFSYRSPAWKTSRRVIAVRKHRGILPKASGKLLLFDQSELPPVYRYSVYVTNMDLPAVQIWNMYKDRGDAENRIKELKYDFAINGFCLKKFWATEAAFRLIMVAYNLMSLFRHSVLQHHSQATLATLKFKCFALGSWITRRSRENILKISISGRKRDWLEGLFSKVDHVSFPIDFSIA